MGPQAAPKTKPMRPAPAQCELCSEPSRASYQLRIAMNVFFACGSGSRRRQVGSAMRDQNCEGRLSDVLIIHGIQNGMVELFVLPQWAATKVRT